ncbi:hypothetical protein [Streptomyces sp. NPDC091371]|uniref:hypothetical protein n=1 Tax=Streptomyces sp. NPDC091371 TaxID=3155303 RepID=UPI003432CEE7
MTEPDPYTPETVPAAAPPMPVVAPVVPRNRWKTAAVVLAVTQALTLGVVAVVAVSGSGQDASKDPKTFQFNGVFVLSDADSVGNSSSAGRCFGTGGYNDIREGTSVTVYDKAGTVLAVGSLGASTFTDGGYKGVDKCAYKVAVDGVPTGAGFYQVEVSHRGKVNLSEADAVAGNFAASL